MLLLADVHAHAYANSLVLPDGRNKRLMDIMQCLDNAMGVADGPIVIAGDLFHDRKGVRPEVLHRVGDWLAKCRESKIPVFILAGNHDLSIGGDGSASVVALRHATIVTHPMVFEVAGVNVGFIPYTESPETVRSNAKFVKKNGATVLVAHLGIGDPRFADCVPVDYEVPGTIALDDLRPDDFEQVFIGHYHNPQPLAGNVRYIGSPLQLTFKEAGQTKGFMRMDKRGVVTRIPNTWSPRFHKMKSNEAVAKLAHNEIKETDFLWVTDCSPDDVKALAKHANDTGQAVRIDREQPVQTKVRIDADATQDQMVEQYVRHAAPETSREAAKELAATGVALLTQASQEGA
jgi:DNA repair exonuclease SbcCD nuclease subunit